MFDSGRDQWARRCETLALFTVIGVSGYLLSYVLQAAAIQRSGSSQWRAVIQAATAGGNVIVAAVLGGALLAVVVTGGQSFTPRAERVAMAIAVLAVIVAAMALITFGLSVWSNDGLVLLSGTTASPSNQALWLNRAAVWAATLPAALLAWVVASFARKARATG